VLAKFHGAGRSRSRGGLTWTQDVSGAVDRVGVELQEDMCAPAEGAAELALRSVRWQSRSGSRYEVRTGIPALPERHENADRVGTRTQRGYFFAAPGCRERFGTCGKSRVTLQHGPDPRHRRRCLAPQRYRPAPIQKVLVDLIPGGPNFSTGFRVRTPRVVRV